ncbi:MAG: hypothetical protein EBZ60_04035 [Betaproteobacteria bacterium]|nr:hypothetical protein [Betaproteobacteria bacterium]
MKLQVVPARQGSAWVRQGITTFWRQPLALSGLFFLFTALISLLSYLSYVGTLLGLAVLPAVSFGLMAAAREAEQGKFPMPRMLFIAFTQGLLNSKRMIGMGLLYALLFGLVLAMSSVFDGGEFARMYLLGGALNEDKVMDEHFQSAAVFSMLMYVPFSALFWHAPALVHWHALPLAKSVFFSTMACLANWRAFAVFGLTWLSIFISTSLVLALISVVLEDGQLSMTLMLPAMMLLVAMFFASTYYSFRECFVSENLMT